MGGLGVVCVAPLAEDSSTISFGSLGDIGIGVGVAFFGVAQVSKRGRERVLDGERVRRGEKGGREVRNERVRVDVALGFGVAQISSPIVRDLF